MDLPLTVKVLEFGVGALTDGVTMKQWCLRLMVCRYHVLNTYSTMSRYI